ncbi:MAG: DUF4145 domain-containing protein [Gilvibacter sp.]
MKHPYTAPKKGASAYHCPHCHAFANQNWHRSGLIHLGINNLEGLVAGFTIAVCTHCDSPAFWNGGKMIFPNEVSAPHPNPDLPEDLKTDFEEARQIAAASPRGAAALLRLVIQKMCIELGEKGKDLNKDIGNLVEKGLSPMIQKALDIVRVVGNESVHPGVIDLRDDPATATKLFQLTNIIADTMISQPKQIGELYEEIIPEGKKEGIENRDNK